MKAIRDGTCFISRLVLLIGFKLYRKTKRFTSRIAFTLIELLVVIGIIAILLTILLPGLKKANDTSKRIVCANNLKQLGLCTMNYVEDNNGYFPRVGNGSGVNSWSWTLLPYTYNTTVDQQSYHPEKYRILYWCPMQNPPGGWPTTHGMPVSYAINSHLQSLDSDLGYSGQNRLKHYAATATKIILLIDCDKYGVALNNLADTITACRHNGKWNAAFIDGHVENIGRDKALISASWWKP